MLQSTTPTPVIPSLGISAGGPPETADAQTHARHSPATSSLGLLLEPSSFRYSYPFLGFSVVLKGRIFDLIDLQPIQIPSPARVRYLNLPSPDLVFIRKKFSVAAEKGLTSAIAYHATYRFNRRRQSFQQKSSSWRALSVKAFRLFVRS